MTARNISWEQFAVCNTEGKGLRLRFEDLCRQLFCNEFLSQNKRKNYLQANPNNPGIETEPVFDEMNQRWIGYQVKYFDNRADYNQICHSAEMTVKHYAGRINHVYLFCNQPLDTRTVGYKRAEKTLLEKNITLEPITNDTILDMVRKYHYLALYYFENHSIELGWFKLHTINMFDNLGERYNEEFNVETIYTRYLALFVHSSSAVNALNKRKTELLQAIEQLISRCRYNAYLIKLKDAVLQIPDIDQKTMLDSIEWEKRVNDSVSCDQKALIEKRTHLEEDLYKARDQYEKHLKENASKKGKNSVIESLVQKEKMICDSLVHEIDIVSKVLSLTSIIAISQEEKDLMLGHCLRIKGRAGIGKSQLLARQTDDLIKENREVLLLLAGNYYSDEPIHQQIMESIPLDFSLSDLIEILEAIGEDKGQIVPVFIDALNETWNHELWKTGLPFILDKILVSPHIKLVISYRSEYEKQLMTNMTMNRLNECGVEIVHDGFEENTVDAVRQFLNYYNITFTPLEYFSIEITNPLFLTLYCKTYSGSSDNVSLPILYDRILKAANHNIQHAWGKVLRDKGYSEDDDIVTPFISELAGYIIKTGNRIFSKKDLLKFDFWKTYDIVAPVFIGLLTKEHILHNFVHCDEELYYFAYDQMNDYYCAREVFSLYSTKEAIKEFLRNTILDVHEGRIGQYGNIDLFINACAIFAEKYGEECIDILDSISDEYELIDALEKYIESYQWRNPNSINIQSFEKVLKDHPVPRDDLWKMLIVNSIKLNHPLNADYLHSILLRYKINDRDYNWTEYINGLSDYDGNRVVQLIQMYNNGETLDYTSKEQTELLLTLLSWLLTSSDRWLRDITSKAMVEILKEHFSLCETLLRKFNSVNDPYVAQRLYGIIFGACCKRKSEEEQALNRLAEYVYNTIFDQVLVYPDILLRDYARMIIERFTWEYPTYVGRIDRRKIRPPYASIPVPDSCDCDYSTQEYSGGLYSIVSSLRFEGMGMYGDFGRYVFQSALSEFNHVDRKTVFNYAMHLIINEYGYTEEQFNDYDTHVGRRYYDRHNTTKRERIGKKYQWLAMYNILARISDHCEMKERWYDEAPLSYQGTWEPYVRDFDPTINENFMSCPDSPVFELFQQHRDLVAEENKNTYPHSECDEKEWIDKESLFFDLQKEDLILTDSNGTKWIVLTRYCDTGRQHLDEEKLLLWCWTRGYFVTEDQAQLLIKHFEEGYDFRNSRLNDGISSYQIYNREYPWAPSCEEIKKYSWKEIQIETGDYETITEEYDLPPIYHLLRQYGLEEADENSASTQKAGDLTDSDASLPEKQIVTRKEPVTKSMGKALTATVDLLWEEEYDASKEKPISWTVPCSEIIDVLCLRQFSRDCYYFDKAGQLAAFDTELNGQQAGFIIRKDLLDRFLAMKQMKLIWFASAEKEVHLPTREISRWSEWFSILQYDGTKVEGGFKKKASNYGR